MNRRTLAILSLAGLVLVLAASTAAAQQPYGIKTTVPFSFKVAGQAYPAGDYVVTFPTLPSRETLLLSKADGEALTFISTSGRDPSQKNGSSYMVFRGYGSQYFLAEISFGGLDVARGLRVSKEEQEISKATKTAGMPMLTKVLVAAR